MATRRDQLRLAKQRQRARDVQAGLGLYQVKLPSAELQRFKAGMKKPHFTEKLREFLNHELIALEDYPALRLLCWNRKGEFLTRREAFDLYERNWRLVDQGAFAAGENELITELADEFGRGVINA